MQTNIKKILPTIGIAMASLFYSSCGNSGVFDSKKTHKARQDYTARIDDVMTKMANDYLSEDSRNDPVTLIGPTMNPESDLQISIAHQVINTFMRLPTRTCGYTHILVYFENYLPQDTPPQKGRILIGNPEYSPLLKEAREKMSQTQLNENAGRIEAYKDGDTLKLVITGDSQQAQISALEAITQALYEVEGFFDPKKQETVTVTKFGDAHSVDVTKFGGELHIEPVK